MNDQALGWDADLARGVRSRCRWRTLPTGVVHGSRAVPRRVEGRWTLLLTKQSLFWHPSVLYLTEPPGLITTLDVVEWRLPWWSRT